MRTIAERIKALSDSEVLDVTRELYDIVYTTVPYEEVRKNVDGMQTLNQIAELEEDEMEVKLSPSDSVSASREVVAAYASDPGAALLLERALDNVQNADNMMVDPLMSFLAVGVVANLTLFNVSTSIRWEKKPDGTTHQILEKKAIPPKLLDSVTRLIAQIAKAAGQIATPSTGS